MSYIDPTIVPDTLRERGVLQEIRRRKLTLHRLHADGAAVRLSGPGVYITASSLGSISVDDLAPADHASVNKQHRGRDAT